MADPSVEPNRPVGTPSYFAQRLASDAELALRCEGVAQAVRDAAREDIQAGERSERLTKDDFAVYINARADMSLTRDE